MQRLKGGPIYNNKTFVFFDEETWRVISDPTEQKLLKIIRI